MPSPTRFANAVPVLSRKVETDRVRMHAVHQPISVLARKHLEAVHVTDVCIPCLAPGFDEFARYATLLLLPRLRLGRHGLGGEVIMNGNNYGRFRGSRPE